MNVSTFETLESRTMMSAVLHPQVEAAAKVPAKVAVKKPAIKVPLHTTVKTIKTIDPITTDKKITYKSFATQPLFASTGPSMSDVNQGYLGDCYLLSTLSSVVKTDAALIRKDIVSVGEGIYTVTFAKGKQITVDADLPVWPDGRVAYAQLGNEGSIWVAIYEKAYAEYHNPKANSYATINGGWMSDAFSALGFSSQSTTVFSSADALITTLAADLKAGDFTTFGTSGSVPKDSPMIAGHAYKVDSIHINAAGKADSITLRNPWGRGAANDGFVTVTAAQAYAVFTGVVVAHV